MLKLCCDICGKPVRSYVDLNGRIWDNFTIRERRHKKPQIKVASFYEYWWDELNICGKCRKAITEYRNGSDES